jgi:4-carboxymuconolactone decarboxylase
LTAVPEDQRFRRLTPDELDDEQREVIEPIVAFIGGIEGPFIPTLRSAEILKRSFALGEHLLFETTLPRRLVEMAVLIRARVSGSQFEWFAHHDRALEAGLPESVCTALQEGRRPVAMTDDERVLFDFSIELLTAPSVSDDTFARARDAFGERGIVELTYVLGFYGMIALILKVAEVANPDGSTPLAPMPDPFSG